MCWCDFKFFTIISDRKIPVVLYKKAEQKRLDIKQNQVQGTVAKAQIPSQHIAI